MSFLLATKKTFHYFFFQYLLLLYVPCLTCNAIPRLCRFHFVGATFGPQEFIRNLKHLSYSTFVILILWNIFACLSGKLSTEFTSPIAKSTSPGLLDRTFFARCIHVSIIQRLNSVLTIVTIQERIKLFCFHARATEFKFYDIFCNMQASDVYTAGFDISSSLVAQGLQKILLG